MGVAATAGLDATSTTNVSYVNPLTANNTGFTVVQGNTPTFDSARGMTFTGTSAGAMYKSGVSPTKGADLAWRWTAVSAQTATYDQVCLHASSGTANSFQFNTAATISVSAYEGAIKVWSRDTSNQITAVPTLASPAVVNGEAYDLRWTVTEAGLMTLTVRAVGTGITTVVVDNYDVTGLAFWTGASAGGMAVRYQSSSTTGNGCYISRLREVAHPAGEVVRAPRGSLVQLSDGTSAWVEAAATAAQTTVTVWRDPKTSAPAQVGTFTIAQPMYHPPVIARDSSDNLYVALSTTTARHYRQLVKSGSGSSATWAVGPANSIADGVPYTIRGLRWVNTGYLVSLLWRNQSGVDALFAGQVSRFAAGTFSDASATSTATATAGRARIALMSTDSDNAAAGILVTSPTAGSGVTVTVARWTCAANGAITITSLGTVVLNSMTLALSRVGSQWVLTGANSSGQLVAHVISTTAVAAAVACPTAALAGEPTLGFGDATWDGTRVSRIMPVDYGAAMTTTDYVRARFDPATGTWTAPASYVQVAGQAKELATVVATGPLSLAPEVTRADGTTDWLITSLGAPSSGGSAAYTVHDTDVVKASVSGVVRNGDGSAYTGGALVALVRADGTVLSTTTSSTTDGTYSLPMAASGLYEVVAFSADGALTAATGIKATV